MLSRDHDARVVANDHHLKRRLHMQQDKIIEGFFVCQLTYHDQYSITEKQALVQFD